MNPRARLISSFCAVFALYSCASRQAPPPPPAAAGPAPQVPATKPPPERVAADTPRATPGGATFTVPSGWTFEGDGSVTLLTGSEPDIRIAIVDSPAKGADEAVASAWRLF